MSRDTPASFALFDTPLGRCGIAWRGTRVVATQLPEASDQETAERLSKRAGGATPGDPPPAVERAIAAMSALLEGSKDDLASIDCDFDGLDGFHVRVYAATRAIPPGATLTYGEVASRLGDKRLAQAVGQALGRNPLPIIVPCHRVVGASGKLTGFSANGGIALKLRMLASEGAAVARQGGLFDDLPLAVKPVANPERSRARER